MLYYCKSGYDADGNVVYRAICPEIDNIQHYTVLAELGPKSANVDNYSYQHLTKAQVRQIDDEIAEYCALAERYTWAGLLVLAAEIENGVKNFWQPNPGFHAEFHEWYIKHKANA